MNSETADRAEQLELELQFYRDEYNEIGARLLRLQEQQSRVSREARRSKIVARLIRDAYQVVNQDIAPGQIGDTVLVMLLDTSFCDRAAFLKEDPAAPGVFTVEHIIGAPRPEPLTLGSVPEFLFTASGKPAPPPAALLGEAIGLNFILWAYDPGSGRALLLGNQLEGNIRRPFEAGDEEFVSVALAVYIDVLLRKQAELTLQRARQTAEDANNSRARFLANLSHELRTPLNSIIGFSELLLETGTRAPPAAQREEFTRQILDAGRSLLSLAKDILDFSSLSHARPRLHRDWVPVAQLLHNAIRAFAVEVTTRGTRIEILPPAPGLQAIIDYDRFRQILANLIGNAIKFTPAGRAILVSCISTDQDGLIFSVRDHGIGIQPDNLARVLEPFVQIKSSFSHDVHGAGLGLPIAKQLVEAHQGEMRIESVYGEGTEVIITLPPGSARIQPQAA
ncbi:MAG: HAMP domain-containing sensor histidine kinase [Acidocella sp.]|nr:HAMP domain-containing sensor histidine kinase [Acidocella sp.]